MVPRIFQDVRPRWLPLAYAASGALALFGTVAVAFAPMLTPASGPWRGIYLFAIICILKFPLIILICWHINRTRERPDLPGVWSRAEQQQIIARIRAEAQAAARRSGGGEILVHLAGEAWHVADRVDDDLRAEAVALAIALRERARRARRRLPVS